MVPIKEMGKRCVFGYIDVGICGTIGHSLEDAMSHLGEGCNSNRLGVFMWAQGEKTIL